MAGQNTKTTILIDKKEYFAVDIFRLIFAIGIVALHLSPLEDICGICNYFLINVITRIGVPFFFLVSGFFLYKKIYDYDKVKMYINKLMKQYLIYTFIYMPQILYVRIKSGGSILKNILGFIRNFFFIGSYVQLWYFVGLIIATVLLYFLVNKSGLSDKALLIIIIVLYIIGTIFDAYILPDKFETCIQTKGTFFYFVHFVVWVYMNIFVTTRNGIFFGLPYLFFGYLIAKNKKRILKKSYLVMFMISFFLMLLEVLVVVKLFGNLNGQNMLFSLLPTALFFFLFILFIDWSNLYNCNRIAKHCRSLSAIYFGWHLFIDFYVNGFFKYILHIKLHSLLQFVIVLLLNYILGEILIYISNKSQLKWVRCFY